MQAVVFRLAGAAYALPVEAVREVVPYRRPRGLPKIHPWELGLVSLRGELVRVWDLAARLRLEAAVPSGPLVVAAVEPPIAFAVDAIVGVREVEHTRFAELDGELVEVLDAAALFATDEPDDDGLDALPLSELRRLAGEAEIAGRWQLGRDRLIAALRDARNA
jgi:chemotaxis signal transduction protein